MGSKPKIWIPTNIVCGGERAVQIIQRFLIFRGPNHSGSGTKKAFIIGAGAGAKSFRCLDLESEPESHSLGHKAACEV